MNIEIKIIETDSKSLKKKKESVLKKYSPTRSKSLEVANELAVILFALGRKDESLEMLKSYSEKSPLEAPRYERWEAACYAMLLQLHIEEKSDNKLEFQRLLNKVSNEHFNPNSWFTENDFDEFTSSINTGVDHIDGATRGEKLQVRTEGVLALLYAYYFWTNNWPKFYKRASEIEAALEAELIKVARYVS